MIEKINHLMNLYKNTSEINLAELKTDLEMKLENEKLRSSILKRNKLINELKDKCNEQKMIMAEIIDYRHFNQYSNIILTTIRFYLFRFDDKMRIDRVYSFNMQSE